MTSHSDKLTALGFKTDGIEQWHPKLNQYVIEYCMPNELRQDLFLCSDGKVLALGGWFPDMHIDEFLVWWRDDQQKKQKPVRKQRGLFDE